MSHHRVIEAWDRLQAARRALTWESNRFVDIDEMVWPWSPHGRFPFPRRIWDAQTALFKAKREWRQLEAFLVDLDRWADDGGRL